MKPDILCPHERGFERAKVGFKRRLGMCEDLLELCFGNTLGFPCGDPFLEKAEGSIMEEIGGVNGSNVEKQVFRAIGWCL